MTKDQGDRIIALLEMLVGLNGGHIPRPAAPPAFDQTKDVKAGQLPTRGGHAPAHTIGA